MNRKSIAGFTLVELCVVLAVMAILATFATPSFFAWQTRDQVDARARSLFSTLSLARAESLRRGARITLCRIDAARHCLASGKSCDNGVTDWSCGWALLSIATACPRCCAPNLPYRRFRLPARRPISRSRRLPGRSSVAFAASISLRAARMPRRIRRLGAASGSQQADVRA
ncbi:GspH/FimT family pseudopilin [Caballeronia sp. LZ016]|uniref:GspH/FimT family pseudopilin n=1 Tax=Caballeronia sp. LZ016 TaxID=3038554 RepID=UPI0038577E2F